MSAQFWSATCFAAHERPVSTLLSIVRGVSGVLIAAFCCVCIANAACFLLWNRLHRDSKSQIWHLFGWFSALAALGCGIGTIAFAAFMMQLSDGYEANRNLGGRDFHLLSETIFRWKAVYVALFPLEFMCVSIAKLMVLERLYVFALPQLDAALALRLKRFGIVVVICVVICNLISVAANFAQAVQLSRAASFMQQAAAAAADAAAATSLSASAQLLFHDQAQPLATLQSMSETTLLLVVIVAFIVVGFYSLRRIDGALLQLVELSDQPPPLRICCRSTRAQRPCSKPRSLRCASCGCRSRPPSPPSSSPFSRASFTPACGRPRPLHCPYARCRTHFL